jgi:hypothetical protein
MIVSPKVITTMIVAFGIQGGCSKEAPAIHDHPLQIIKGNRGKGNKGEGRARHLSPAAVFKASALVTTLDTIQPEYDFILPATSALPSQRPTNDTGRLIVISQSLILPTLQEMSPSASDVENCAHVSVTLKVAASPRLAALTCGTTGGNNYLRQTMPYRAFWDGHFNKQTFSSDLVCVFKSAADVTGAVTFRFEPRLRANEPVRNLYAPPKPGLYNMRFEWVNTSSVVPMSRHLVRFPLDVTCELDGKNDFCGGAKRYIKNQCLSTLQPCGLDAIHCNPADPSCDLSIYSNATLCAVYPCDPVARRCGIYPAAVTRKAIIDPQLTLALVDPVANLTTCAACTEAPCKPDCTAGRKCGGDGCGGYCGKLINGTCPSGLECSGQGICIEPSGPSATPGTCGNPFDIFNLTQTTVGSYNATAYERYLLANNQPAVRPVANQAAWFAGNASDGVSVPESGALIRITYSNGEGLATDQVSVTCSVSGGIPDIIYRFRVTRETGFEAMILDISGDPTKADTILALHGGPGNDTLHAPQTQCDVPYSADQYPANVICADDSVPPAGLGSRVFAAFIPPGVYYLVATSYAAQAAKPYQLWLKFTDTNTATYSGAAPKCAEKMCGDDEAGYVCNPSSPCTEPNSCTAIGLCVNCPVVNYEPDCAQRQCGIPGDGCTADPLCGTCKPDQRVCDVATGKCVVDQVCDPLVPTCNSDTNFGKKGDVWCGNDCSWRRSTEPLFDMISGVEREIIISMYLERRSFSATSCAFQEGCIKGSGPRLLFRQTTNVHNQALIGYEPGDQSRMVRDFVYASCHQHLHFLDFASFYGRAIGNFIVTALNGFHCLCWW